MIKEYSEKLLNKVRIFGSTFSDARIVENFFVTIPEKYEATITTSKNTKDLSTISLVELLNTLQAQEQQRLMRQDQSVERAV